MAPCLSQTNTQTQVLGPKRVEIRRRLSTLTSGLKPWIIVWPMKLSLSVLFALLAAVSLMAASSSSDSPPGDPVRALMSVQGSEALIVKRDVGRLEVGTPGAHRPLLSLAADGVASLRTGLERPAGGQPANVRETRDATGDLLWHVAHTSRGARLLVTQPGVLHPEGLHVVVFDNDDLHIASSDGGLLYARRTLEDGTLLEQEGVDGCDCALRTTPQGDVTTEGR